MGISLAICESEVKSDLVSLFHLIQNKEFSNSGICNISLKLDSL